MLLMGIIVLLEIIETHIVLIFYFPLILYATESMDSAMEATDFFHEDASVSDKGEKLSFCYSDCGLLVPKDKRIEMSLGNC